MSQIVSGDEIRAGYGCGVDWDARVLDVLSQRGAMTTREIHLDGLNCALKYGSLVSVLAGMVDTGRIVAEKKATTSRGGRPGIVWRVA